MEGDEEDIESKDGIMEDVEDEQINDTEIGEDQIFTSKSFLDRWRDILYFF